MRWTWIGALGWTLVRCTAAYGCVAGGGDVHDDDDGSNRGSAKGAGGAGVATTGTGEVNATATGTGGAPTGPTTAAVGVAIREVAIYQGVKRPLMRDGDRAASTVPVIAGREALLRVFYETNAAYDGGEVVARLSLSDGSTWEATGVASGTSREETLESSFNIALPKGALTVGAEYRIDLVQRYESAAHNPEASFPASGMAEMEVLSAGQELRWC